MNSGNWKFWIDVGGTFTDCLGKDPVGCEHQIKVLSSGLVKGNGVLTGDRELVLTNVPVDADGFWNSVEIEFFNESGERLFQSIVHECSRATKTLKFEDEIPEYVKEFTSFQLVPTVQSPILAAHLLTRTPLKMPLPKSEMYLGTTKGTNALLTRSGSRTALLTSSGLQDFLAIGDQTRRKLFDLVARKSDPLYEVAIEIDERVLVDGTVEKAPNIEQVKRQLRELKSQGIESLAICFIHAFRFDEHERIVGSIAKEIGFKDVRLSCEVAPLIRLVYRGETTVLDAYLNPVISSYLDNLQEYLGASSTLKLMTSSGALTSRHLFSGKDSVLSGPAGGAVGSARIAEQIGYRNSIGFDMGGTSTDVSRYDGEFQIDFESRKADVRILSPMMSVETVAAGGGSICRFDGTRFLVGPESAGADPGPACYGSGGPLTVTDINLFLGRLDSKQFPFELDRTSVQYHLTVIQKQLADLGLKKSLFEVASGFLEIANQSMAMAIKNVSAARGIDPREYLLVAFGGAGGQHCCGVADCLDISKILLHPQSSILSAVGIRLSDQSLSGARTVLRLLTPEFEKEVRVIANEVADETLEKFINAGNTSDVKTELSADLRYLGTDSSINVLIDEGNLQMQFESAHQQYFGYVQNREIEVVSVRANVVQHGERLESIAIENEKRLIESATKIRVCCDGNELSADLFDWNQLDEGMEFAGPAIVSSPLTSAIVDPGWKVVVLKGKQLLLQRSKLEEAPKCTAIETTSSDPVLLELFNGQFQVIAEQMGQILKKTAISVNVKQRLDFSCAIFSELGELVVNAPHIPVHLGAMSDTVKATIKLNEEISEGDVFVTNDPYQGGSHLPDVTVITPVFFESERPVFWVASRAHHAEIGGMAPGSMPASASKLEEEGVVIRNLKLIDKGRSRFDDLNSILKSAVYPSRNSAENLADVAAQIAANKAGVDGLVKLVRDNSLPVVKAYMKHIKTAAEQKTRSFIRSLPNSSYQFEDFMDDQTRICVEITVSDDDLVIDFAGTYPTHPGNLNANESIVSSTIMYVLRCMIDEDIPMNQGILSPLDIRIPDCFLNPSASKVHGQSPAVVGGNVETSQGIVDVLFGAFGSAAASQGTMNNWLIGDSSFGYYETVGGGSGASSSQSGTSAVHCHMSNTCLTDPEVLETRYPMILRDFRIRNGSGGLGKQMGGNGMIREVEFTKPLILSLLTSRRTTCPFGLNGGESGLAGENWLMRTNGNQELLASQCQHNVNVGERLRLLTPGGGGYGSNEN